MNIQMQLTQVLTPRVFIATGANPPALQAAVDAQTNTLNKTLRTPAEQTNDGKGTITYYTSGNVANDSIAVSNVWPVVANNVISYTAAITWKEWVTPS